MPFADTLGRLRCHLKFQTDNEIQAGVASPGPPFIKKRGEADPPRVSLRTYPWLKHNHLQKTLTTFPL